MLGLALVALGWTIPGSAGFAERAAADYPYAGLALAGDEGLLSGSARFRLEGGCNVARTPLGDIVLRGSVATMQPVSQAHTQGIVTKFGAHRFFGISLGPIGARADATVQYANLNLGRAGFGEVYSFESGFLASAGRRLEWGLRYRGNYDESQFAAPAANPVGGWLHQFCAVTNWHRPVPHGAFTVGATAGYLVDRVANSKQNGGWLLALAAQYPVSRRLSLMAGSGYNEREYRPYVLREPILIDRPENTWSSNVGVSYAASERSSMRLEWVGSAPASELKPFSFQSSNLLLSVTASY